MPSSNSPTEKHSPRRNWRAAKVALAKVPKRLNSRHRILMLELARGRTVKDAAELAGMHPGRASQVIASPLFRAEFERLTAEIRDQFVTRQASNGDVDYLAKLKSLAPKAVDNLERVLDYGESEPTRAKVALAVLDKLNIGGPSNRTEVAVTFQPGISHAIERALATFNAHNASTGETAQHDEGED